jgi:hypothetical protein
VNALNFPRRPHSRTAFPTHGFNPKAIIEDAIMDVDLVDAPNSGTQHFNGAVPIKRARLDLTTTTTTPDAAQLRRRKEAEKAYGRGRKIPCK